MTEADPRKQFGETLRRLRRERKLSQEKLGVLAGTEAGLDHPIRRNQIIRYEQGGRYPRLEFRIALARALGVSLATLDEDVLSAAPTTEGQDSAA